MSLDLIQAIRAQSKLHISQAISLVENQKVEANQLLSDLFKYTGNAFRIGITGPPGAGKSSLTNNLLASFRDNGRSVAVIAIDPTSPFSGGAVLGDRIRMKTHHSDDHVFIRSMATRGARGGLAIQSEQVGEIFDAANFDIIIYETVGVGQIELDIIQAVDTVLVVLVPESGDEVQMLKAGLIEIGNIFAINKADRPGSNKLMISLKNLFSNFTYDDTTWEPTVIHTIATEGIGTNDLLESIQKHQSFNESKGVRGQKYTDRYYRRVHSLVNEKFHQTFWDDDKTKLLQCEMKKNPQDRISPYNFAEHLCKK